MLQEKVKDKFAAREFITAKYVPKFPKTAEREMTRVINGYLRTMIKEPLTAHLLEIKEQVFAEKNRQDSVEDVLLKIFEAFAGIDEERQLREVKYNLRTRLAKIASIVRRFSKEEWKKAVHKTLGINLLDDYYDGEFYSYIFDNWVDYNVNLIVTIPKNTLEKMKQIMLDGFLNGESYTEIVKKVEHSYSVTRSHARLIARDQMGKLNSQIARKQQQDAGISRYEWTTAGDRRVRESHGELNGKTFSWDDPPIVDERTGRRCHPGEDYQCRCIGIPIFEFTTLNLPIKEE